MNRHKYTTGERIRSILILAGLIANLILWGTVLWQETRPEPETVGTIEMANRHITWSGAGYQQPTGMIRGGGQ